MLRADVWRLNTVWLVSEVDSECFCIAALQWFKASCAKYIAQTCGPQKWKHCVKRYRCCWAFEAVDWWKATDRTGQAANQSSNQVNQPVLCYAIKRNWIQPDHVRNISIKLLSVDDRSQSLLTYPPRPLTSSGSHSLSSTMAMSTCCSTSLGANATVWRTGM